MINDFLISFKVKNTYIVNQIIFSLKKLPIIGKLFSAKLYGKNYLKIIGIIIGTIKEIIKIFGYKILYILFFLIMGIGYYKNPNQELFIHIYLFLAVIGSFSNTEIFNPSKDKYYMIVLMKMNAKNHAITNFMYFLLSTFIGQLTAIILFASSLVSWYYAILLVTVTLMLKCLAINIYFYRMKTTNRVINENKPSSWFIYSILIIICLLLAYGLPYFNIIIPLDIFHILSFIIIVLGIISLLKIMKYNKYQKLYKELLVENNIIFTKDSQTNTLIETNKKQISVDKDIESNKFGYAYFHDLFVKRHKKIVKNHAIKTTFLIMIVTIFLVLSNYFVPQFNKGINRFVLTFLSYSLLLMYFINTGGKITNAMFINCDHSMLVYRFFRQSDTILSLFKERMKTVILINVIPSLTLGLSLCILLFVSGGTDNSLNYLVIFLSTIATSIFFSVHHLVIYYLMQPYNIGMEIKNISYTIVNIVTYWVAYYIAGINIPTIIFGSIMILFAIIYSVISLLLVYKYAPKTFKLKQ